MIIAEDCLKGVGFNQFYRFFPSFFERIGPFLCVAKRNFVSEMDDLFFNASHSLDVYQGLIRFNYVLPKHTFSVIFCNDCLEGRWISSVSAGSYRVNVLVLAIFPHHI